MAQTDKTEFLECILHKNSSAFIKKPSNIYLNAFIPEKEVCFWYILNRLDVSYITTVFQLYQKNILFHWKVDEIITFCVSSSETVDGFGGQLARTDVFPSLKDMESAMQKAMKTM